MLGLLAPEMIVYTALEQRGAALRLTKEMRAILGDPPKPRWWQTLCFFKRGKNIQEGDGSAFEHCETRSQARRHQWTHIHSFYALMGDFAFDTSEAKPSFLPGGRSRLTLRFEALKFIAKRSPSLIPDLPAEEIRDRSKADGLAKLLVCMQATWFSVQFIARVAEKQAISFLELNTFGHAICALLIYASWWLKPLDIDSPSLLVGEEAWELCALMCVTSNRESLGNTIASQFLVRQRFSSHDENLDETEFSRGQKYGNRVIRKRTDVSNDKHLARLRQHRYDHRMILRWDPAPEVANTRSPIVDNTVVALEEAEVQAQDSSGVSVRIKKGDSLFGFRCMDVYGQADWSCAQVSWPPPELILSAELYFINPEEDNYQLRTAAKDAQMREGTDNSERYCILDSSDLRRWGLVSRAWQKYEPKLEDYHFLAGDYKPEICNTVCDRMRNWPSSTKDGIVPNGLYGGDYRIQLLTITITGGLYGGLHLLAWNALFVDWWQQSLWRISGSLVASSGLMILSLDVLWTILGVVAHRNDASVGLRPLIRSLLLCVLMIPFVSCSVMVAFCYIPARIFLTVESCLQISRLPPSAYELPQWSQFYPHIV